MWEIEHGPRGGDEVNIIGKGKNYGWPVIGYGIDYNGAKIHESTAKEGMEQPIKYWVPSIAPSGMAFYTGSLFPKWNGSLFTGALAGKCWCGCRSMATRSPARSGCCKISTSGSATSGKDPTARCGCLPTIPRDAFCA